jgi:hypothetical protein
MKIKELTIDLSVSRVRQIASQVTKREFSSSEAEAFLLLYGEQLETKLFATVKQFLSDKLGA